MKKVYLFCSAGMSTSMLANSMQKVADKVKLDVEVKAFSESQIHEIVDSENPDAILLGPQIRYKYDKIVEEFKDKNIPISVIDSADYGAMDGEKVLKTAVKLIKENMKK